MEDVFAWVVAMVRVVSEEQQVKNWTSYRNAWTQTFISKTKLKVVHRNITCDPERVTAIVNTNLRKVMTPPTAWALDETVLACEINGAPTVFSSQEAARVRIARLLVCCQSRNWPPVLFWHHQRCLHTSPQPGDDNGACRGVL